MEKVRSLGVMGAQWGDEGKGKIIDFLAEDADIVARFQGGNNAGHTVVVGERLFKLHHVPSGILYSDVLCLLGNGMVINPLVLIEELSSLESQGIETGRLFISDKAHVIMYYHLALDEVNEAFLGSKKIGTTGRGIGPAYADKAWRRGLRIMDLVDFERFRDVLAGILPLQNHILQKVYDHPGFNLDEILDQYRPAAERLRPLVVDASALVDDYISRGKRVLYEGAQGTLLDIDHGTYPHVTSSSTIAGAVSTGLGLGVHRIGEVLGVMKAYTTRVGSGPFPTEDSGKLGDQLRLGGAEFGTTTGRPRRCGWFDGVVARYSSRINGFTGLAITKLDVLTGFEKIYIADAYFCRGKKLKLLPSDLSLLGECKPVYRELPGWQEDISGARSLKDLPSAARNCLQTIEEIVQAPISIISVGPGRSQTIIPAGSCISSWR